MTPKGEIHPRAGGENLLPGPALLPTWGWGKAVRINGIFSTLATKGNEKEIGRKLEPEARSACEYFHIKKHCFQKNIPVSRAQENPRQGSGFRDRGDGRRRSEIARPGSFPGPVLPWPRPARPREAGQPSGPLTPALGSASAGPRPHPISAPP